MNRVSETDTKELTPPTMRTQLNDWLMAKSSPELFLEQWALITDPQEMGTFPFLLWDFQKELVGKFQESKFLIVLKARQLGISWLVAGYALWLAMFHENANILMLSKGEKEAGQLLLKARFIYDHLPLHLQAKKLKWNDSQVVFAGNRLSEKRWSQGSRITALPATKEAARSETATVVIADEWAFHPYAEDNFIAFQPTIDRGGRLIAVSTANGIGTFFHGVWSKAELQENDFIPIFLPWYLHPERDEDWYQRTRKNYPEGTQKWFQEYPANTAEAFVSAGGCVFDLSSLIHYMDNTVRSFINVDIESIPPHCHPIVEDLTRRQILKVWEFPRPGAKYVAGCDPAEGLPKRDYSVTMLFNVGTGQQAAELRCHDDLDIFAGDTYQLCRAYNSAFLCVERNNHGHTVIHILSNDLGYDTFLYRHKEFDSKVKKHVGRLGWPSSTRTKNKWIDDLVGGVRDLSITIHDRAWVEEAKGFVRLASGTAGAIGSGKDDRITATGLALEMFGIGPQVAKPMRSYRKRVFRHGH